MSKSKRNTVDPDDIIGTYGADTARWFVLSDSPPERDVDLDRGRRPGRVALRAAAVAAGRRGGRDRGKRARASGRPRSASRRLRCARPRMARSPRCRQEIEQAALQRLRRAYLRIRQCASTTRSAHVVQSDGHARFRLGGARGRRHPGAALPPDDAASGRGMLGRAGPQDAGLGAALAGGRARPCWSRTPITLPVQVNGKKRADVTVPRDATETPISRLPFWRSMR